MDLKFGAARVCVTGLSKREKTRCVLCERDFTTFDALEHAVDSYVAHGLEAFSHSCDGDTFTDIRVAVSSVSHCTINL